MSVRWHGSCDECGWESEPFVDEVSAEEAIRAHTCDTDREDPA